MKKSFAERLIASSIRTIIAIIIIAIGAWVMNMAMNWKVWCPNNDLGTLVVILMYTGSIMLVFYGIYLISPIYIGTAGCILIEKVIEKTVISEEDEDEDEDEDEEDFREKVIRLRRKYLW